MQNTGALFMSFYAVISLLALHLFITNPLGELFLWNKISIIALLYLFFFIYIFCKLLVKPSNATKIANSTQQKIILLYVFVIIFSLVDVLTTIENFRTGLFQLMVDSEYGNEIYQETTLTHVHTMRSNGPVSYVGVFSNLSRNLAPVLLLFSLTQKNINKAIVIGLLIATFCTYMTAISQGIRSVIVQNLLAFSFLFIFLRKFYSDKVKRVLKPILIVFFGVIILGTALITISRIQAGDSEITEFIESYSGQSVLYFGSYGLDNGPQIRNGDRTFPLIKSIFSDKVARSTFERRNKYQLMKINESVFTTFVGDFVFDYGLFWGGLILLVIYYVFKFLLARSSKIIHFDEILIVYLLIYLLCGFYLYPMGEYAGNIMFVSIILLSIFYRIQRNGRHNYKSEKGRDSSVLL